MKRVEQLEKERMEQNRKIWEEIVKTHPLNSINPIYPPVYYKAKDLLKEIERQKEIRSTFKKLISLIFRE